MEIIIGMTEDRRVTNEILHMKIPFKMLFDKETGLWENGPTYIAEEYAEIG